MRVEKEKSVTMYRELSYFLFQGRFEKQMLKKSLFQGNNSKCSKIWKKNVYDCVIVWKSQYYKEKKNISEM